MRKTFKEVLDQVHFIDRVQLLGLTGITVASIAAISMSIFVADNIITGIYNFVMFH